MSRPLRLATFLAPATRPAYEAVVAALGPPAELVDGGDLDAVDGAFLCGLPYVRHGGLEAIAAPVLEWDRPVYFSDVIVPASSQATSFEDLLGARWAFNERGSHSGYNAVLAELYRRGEGDGYFSEAVETGGHAASVELVARGEADGAAIDSQVLAQIGDTRVRRIERIGPSPAPPLAVRADLEPELRAALLEAALAAPPAAGVERWVAVSDSDYDPIRATFSQASRARLVADL